MPFQEHRTTHTSEYCILDSQFGPDSYPITMPDTDAVIFSKTRGWFRFFLNKTVYMPARWQTVTNTQTQPISNVSDTLLT